MVVSTNMSANGHERLDYGMDPERLAPKLYSYRVTRSLGRKSKVRASSVAVGVREGGGSRGGW